MWITLQVILGHLRLLPNFWPKIFEEKKKSPRHIIVLHLHPKSHNYLMYGALKMILIALQVSLGQFLPFYSIFSQNLQFLKNGKMPKTY